MLFCRALPGNTVRACGVPSPQAAFARDCIDPPTLGTCDKHVLLYSHDFTTTCVFDIQLHSHFLCNATCRALVALLQQAFQLALLMHRMAGRQCFGTARPPPAHHTTATEVFCEGRQRSWAAGSIAQRTCRLHPVLRCQRCQPYAV